MIQNTLDSRRAFFKKIKGYATSKYMHSEHPRPPWALRNSDFLELCNKCYACIDACPQKVLKISTESHPSLNGFPILSLEYNSCTFCKNCVNSCSVNALNLILGIRKQVFANINYSYCDLNLQYSCHQCKSVCGVNAIKINGYNITIDKEICNGCAECVIVCTNKAISMIKCHDLY